MLVDETPALRIEFSGAEGSTQDGFRRLLIGAFALDFEKRQLPIEMVAHAHLVSGTAAASVVVIHAQVGGIEVACGIPRGEPGPGAQHAIVVTQTEEQCVERFSWQQVLPVHPRQERARGKQFRADFLERGKRARRLRLGASIRREVGDHRAMGSASAARTAA